MKSGYESNHSGNIVTVYSVEEEADTHFLRMELLHGETLETIVARGALREEPFVNLERPVDGKDR